MNFLDGQITAGGVEVPGLKDTVKLPVSMPSAGTQVQIGLRPEHLLMTKGDTHRVELTEALGGVSYAYLVTPTGEKIIVEERGDERSRIGDKVGLSFEPDRAMLFNAQTEARIR